MKTIEQASREYAKKINVAGEWLHHECIAYEAFKACAEFAQRWIPVEEELPPQITKPTPQKNGNTLYFYENYIVKGYYKNEGKTEETLMAAFMPLVVSWGFNVIKMPGTFGFVVTHWRPIEYK